MAQIDAAITDKNTSASISPADVGDNMKDIVGYVDQEIDAEAAERTAAIDAAAIGIWQDAGNWDASVGTFPTLTNQGGAVDAGSIFQVSVSGTMTGTGSLAVTAGESFRALVDTPGQIANNWRKAVAIYNQATTTAAGIVELGNEAEMNTGTSTTLVPPIKVVADYVANELAGYTPPSLGYTQYIVSLTQSGTSNPTVVINKNTLGLTPTVGYGTLGRVSFLLTGISNSQLDKVRVILSQKTYSGKIPLYYYTITGTTNLVVNLYTYNLANNAYENDMLINTPFEIQIFP